MSDQGISIEYLIYFLPHPYSLPTLDTLITTGKKIGRYIHFHRLHNLVDIEHHNQ